MHHLWDKIHSSFCIHYNTIDKEHNDNNDDDDNASASSSDDDDYDYSTGMYQSVRNSSGYYVDITCDALGGVFLCFGVLFYLFKRFDPAKQIDLSWKSVEAGTSGEKI